MDMTQRLQALYTHLRQHYASTLARCVLFFSVCDGSQRARVVHSTGQDFCTAWHEGLQRLLHAQQTYGLQERWLRIDWVQEAQYLSQSALIAQLQATKRNYFRYGIALDSDFQYAFTEQELNANAMLYAGGTIPYAQVNQQNWQAYARSRFQIDLPFPEDPQTPMVAFTTQGVFCSQEGTLYPLDTGLQASRRQTPTYTLETLGALIHQASEYLVRQVREDGSFVYGVFPCFHRAIAGYNTLRHISTAYAMLEAWDFTHNDALKRAVDRTIQYMCEHFVRIHTLPDGTTAAFLLDVTTQEYKLGSNGVALLLLTKYAELTGSQRFHQLMEHIANGIAFMQDPETGRYVHVLYPDTLQIKDASRIVYYDGEATFGLLRLYSLTKQPRWLALAEKAFSLFIANKAWKHHDHWLSYAVNELTRHVPDPRYVAFGIQNVAGYLDFVLHRETTYPTLLELMNAAAEMLDRIRALPHLHSLLQGIDLELFYQAYAHRAQYLQNGFFWPELAMYYQSPESILGSFFIRHHAFRVRIDDVEHNLSGLIGYHAFLKKQPETRQPCVGSPLWTASSLEYATQGTWFQSPPSGWRAFGLCVHNREPFPVNTLLLAKPSSQAPGLTPAILRNHKAHAAGVLAETLPPPDMTLPWLKVDNVREATFKMGAYARECFPGLVIGVTGSVGKSTTTAMLAQCLNSEHHKAVHSRKEGNTRFGLSWNLASMDQQAAYWVVEVSLGGGMHHNSQLVRPHVAVFTQIAEAHLDELRDLRTVALVKSRLCHHVVPGGIAILNRDMPQYALVAKVAARYGLTVYTYGTHPESQFRLLDWTDGIVCMISKITYRFAFPLSSQHMAMNALACLATGKALGLPLQRIMRQLGQVEPLEGRGKQYQLQLGDKQITLVDESYNANPSSMRAALQALGQYVSHPAQGLVILGDMLELGEQEIQYHLDLEEPIRTAGFERLLLCGPRMRALAQRLPVAVWFEDAQSLLEALPNFLKHEDALMIKGSHGSNLHHVVRGLLERASSVA